MKTKTVVGSDVKNALFVTRHSRPIKGEGIKWTERYCLHRHLNGDGGINPRYKTLVVYLGGEKDLGRKLLEAVPDNTRVVLLGCACAGFAFRPSFSEAKPGVTLNLIRVQCEEDLAVYELAKIFCERGALPCPEEMRALTGVLQVYQ
ncbi:MAG: hypothetical protein Q7S16_05610 [bacterium]|nr:hypothetical protein [bacterium]